MDTPEIEAFLNHLAVKQQVSTSTQNRAFSAILFLYNHVLHKPLSAKIDALRAKTSRRLPTVLSQGETQVLLKALSGRPQLVARLLYGSGLRLMEGLRLRVKDIDFEQLYFRVGMINTAGNQPRLLTALTYYPTFIARITKTAGTC
jgi:site-specific recombinase XerD